MHLSLTTNRMMGSLLMLTQFLFGIVHCTTLITFERIRYGFSHVRILAGPGSGGLHINTSLLSIVPHDNGSTTRIELVFANWN
jgi:hypothetical protein